MEGGVPGGVGASSSVREGVKVEGRVLAFRRAGGWGLTPWNEGMKGGPSIHDGG